MAVPIVSFALAGCLVLAWIRTGGGQRAKPWRDRCRDLGLCVALIVLALAVSGWLARDNWSIAVPLAAGLGCAAAPRAATRLLPPGLIALGLYGFVIARDYGWESWPTSYGLLHVGHFSMQSYFVLPQAYALMAAGGWLAWKTTDRQSPAARVLLGPLARASGWRPLYALLLLPVTATTADLLDPNGWFGPGPAGTLATIAISLAAVALVRLIPAYAADLAVVGLLALGLTGIYLARGWGQAGFGLHLSPIHITNLDYVLYGGVAISSESMAYLAGAQALAFLAVGLWLVPRTIGVHVRAGWRGSALEAELTQRVQRLTQTRTEAVDSAAAELRRLERDLHDGAQARMVEVGMSLRAAERLITTSPDAALALVAEARQTSAQALRELRDLVRGMHPPVLADRGLADAVRAFALDLPITVETDLDLPGRVAAPIESACYFAVAEVLTNAVKHAGARQVQVSMGYRGGMLRIEVSDDGAGGADPAKGSGLAGIEQRLAAFDGILAVSSPPGGPTMIAMEVPCALSSPKISSC